METQALTKNKVPLIIGCCAAVVVVVALGWVFFFRGSSSKLELRELRISRTQNGPAVEEPVFAPREQIWLNAWVGNFARDGETAHIVQDLQLLDPTGKEILNRAGIVEFRDAARPDDEILLPVYVAIPDGFPMGEYKAKISIKDKVGGKTLNREAVFTIKAVATAPVKGGPAPAAVEQAPAEQPTPAPVKPEEKE